MCQTDKLPVFLLQSNTWKKPRVVQKLKMSCRLLELLHTFLLKVRCTANQMISKFIRTHTHSKTSSKHKLTETRSISQYSLSQLSLPVKVEVINFYKYPFEKGGSFYFIKDTQTIWKKGKNNETLAQKNTSSKRLI